MRQLAAKLQTRDQDISLLGREWFTQYVTERMKATRQDKRNLFDIWYQDILRLADRIGSVESVPRKTNLQRNRSNTPTSSRSSIEHYKRSVAIPLLDFCFFRCANDIMVSKIMSEHLLCLVLTLLVRSDVYPMNGKPIFHSRSLSKVT